MRANERARIAWAVMFAFIAAIAIAAMVVDPIDFTPTCDVANAAECSCKVELPRTPFPWEKPQ
jgi:hypothetical protein